MAELVDDNQYPENEHKNQYCLHRLTPPFASFIIKTKLIVLYKIKQNSKGHGENQAVKPIQQATVTRENSSRILYSKITFKRGFGQVSKLSYDRNNKHHEQHVKKGVLKRNKREIYPCYNQCTDCSSK